MLAIVVTPASHARFTDVEGRPEREARDQGQLAKVNLGSQRTIAELSQSYPVCGELGGPRSEFGSGGDALKCRAMLHHSGEGQRTLDYGTLREAFEALRQIVCAVHTHLPEAGSDEEANHILPLDGCACYRAGELR